MSSKPQEFTTLRIPKSSLGYHTNNVYPKFPPMMSDGRSLVSNWQAETVANHKVATENNLTSNWMYRNYLTKHANEIMKTNFVETANDTGYSIPPAEVTRDHAAPFLARYQDSISPYQPNTPSDLHRAYLAGKP
jgi:hypothetical protein